MHKVELIFDSDCPNIERARGQLQQAFVALNKQPRWIEWNRNDPTSPDYVRRYGSPTILIDGDDVAGASPANETDCCRLYMDENGILQGVPTVAAIAAAIRDGDVTPPSHPTAFSGFRAWLPVVPAVGVSLLLKGVEFGGCVAHRNIRSHADKEI